MVESFDKSILQVKGSRSEELADVSYQCSVVWCGLMWLEGFVGVIFLNYIIGMKPIPTGKVTSKFSQIT